jgi:hypothetical protein
MHLCMQDDQIGQKFIGLAPAEMARLPHLINTKKWFLEVNNLVCQLGLHLLRTCLALHGKLSIFYLTFTFKCLDFYGFARL